jgi:hypothetical protein
MEHRACAQFCIGLHGGGFSLYLETGEEIGFSVDNQLSLSIDFAHHLVASDDLNAGNWVTAILESLAVGDSVSAHLYHQPT